MPKWLMITLQVLAALIVVMILYIITLFVLNVDSLIVTSNMEIKQNEQTLILDGFSGPGYLKESNFNTLNPYTETYKRIPKSVNMKGGAEFTYQFWIKVEDTSETYYKDLIILMKGVNQKYKVGLYDKPVGESYYKLERAEPDDYWVACPLIKFGNSYKDFVVRFNTNNFYGTEVRIVSDESADPSSRKNLLSLLPVNWTLLTFVFQDNFSSLDNTENGIMFTMYVNDVLYWQINPSVNPDLRNNFLRQNDGNLFLLPNATSTNEFMQLGNVKYFNYAVPHAEVKTTYQNGPPTYGAQVKSNTIKPAYLSALNKIDIYNY